MLQRQTTTGSVSSTATSCAPSVISFAPAGCKPIPATSALYSPGGHPDGYRTPYSAHEVPTFESPARIGGNATPSFATWETLVARIGGQLQAPLPPARSGTLSDRRVRRPSAASSVCSARTFE